MGMVTNITLNMAMGWDGTAMARERDGEGDGDGKGIGTGYATFEELRSSSWAFSVFMVHGTPFKPKSSLMVLLLQSLPSNPTKIVILILFSCLCNPLRVPIPIPIPIPYPTFDPSPRSRPTIPTAQLYFLYPDCHHEYMIERCIIISHFCISRVGLSRRVYSLLLHILHVTIILSRQI
jgi:hypothetical protein